MDLFGYIFVEENWMKNKSHLHKHIYEDDQCQMIFSPHL